MKSRVAKGAAVASCVLALSGCAAEMATCDKTGLEWAVIELSETEAFERPTIAAQGLIESCAPAMPKIYQSELTPISRLGVTADEATVMSTLPGSPDLQAVQAADATEDAEEAERLWRRACPEALVIDTLSTEHNSAEHRRLRYRRCGLGDLGLMDEEEFVRYDHERSVSLFVWLGDQGVEPELARPLVREAMVRGRRSFPVFPKEVTTLPRSVSASPIPTASTVYLSATTLSTEDETLAKIREGEIAPGESEFKTVGLGPYLREGEAAADAKVPGAGFHGTDLVLVPDQTVTFGTLLRVMDAGADAGYLDYHLVVVRPEVFFPDLGLYSLPVHKHSVPVQPPERAQVSADADPPKSMPAHRIPVGTPLYWSDGRDAGTTKREHKFAGQPVTRGGRWCFEEGGVMLCVDIPREQLG